MTSIRPIEWWEYERTWEDSRWSWTHIPQGKATFHRFTQDHQEYEFGPGHYPAAVIELPNGTVKSVSVEQIRFLDKEDQNND